MPANLTMHPLSRVITWLFAASATSMCLLCSAPAVSYGQMTELTRIHGPKDNDLVIPQAISESIDASALQVITHFLTIINRVQLSAIQATGNLAYGYGDQGLAYPATLTVQDDKHFRLDVQESTVLRSTRILGLHAQVQTSNPSATRSVPLRAASLGLLVLTDIIEATAPGASFSMLDRGTTVVDGQSLHRITLQKLLFTGTTTPMDDQPHPVDLYFDPASSLLVKSVEIVHPSFTDRASYVQVTSYGDYQKAGEASFPFEYSQTLNGQPAWTLHLTAIQSIANFDDTYFHF